MQSAHGHHLRQTLILDCCCSAGLSRASHVGSGSRKPRWIEKPPQITASANPPIILPPIEGRPRSATTPLPPASPWKKLRSLSLTSTPTSPYQPSPSRANGTSARTARQGRHGFHRRFNHSHVLLAACSRDGKAFEEKGRGVFTRQLLNFFKRSNMRWDGETYAGMMHNLKMPHW